MDLPFVDEHAVVVSGGPEALWPRVRRAAHGRLAGAARDPFRALLGTDPPSGFAVVGERPPAELRLAGRHRFARYELRFTLAPAPGGRTRMTARTYAAFPGPHGRLYRLLVISSHAHALAVRVLLRSLAARAAAG